MEMAQKPIDAAFAELIPLVGASLRTGPGAQRAELPVPIVGVAAAGRALTRGVRARLSACPDQQAYP